MELKIEFTDKEITPWGGMILMKKVIGSKEFGQAQIYSVGHLCH